MSALDLEPHRADITDAPRPVGAVVPSALALGAGIVLGHALGRVAVLPWLAGSVAFLIVLLSRPARRHRALALAALSGAAFFLGAARIGLHDHRRPRDAVAALAGSGPRMVTVEGVALGSDRPVPAQAGALARFHPRPPSRGFPMAVRCLLDRRGARVPRRGEVFVVIDGSGPPVPGGALVRLTGILRASSSPPNPGPNARRLGRRRGGALIAVDAALLQVDSGGGPWWRRGREAMRRRAAAALRTGGDRDRDTLLAAMLLGARDEGYPGLSRGFQRVGLAHLLAISGLHLGLVAGAALHALGAMGAVGRRRGWIVIGLVLVYLLVVEVRLPLLRAGLMTMAACLGVCGRRRLDAGGLVAGCGALLLLWQPEQILTAGFQLSFGVVLGLIHLAPSVRRRWFGPPRHDATSAAVMAGQWLAAALAVAVTAWLVATPLAVYHFGVLSPLAAPLSVAAVPLAAIILLAGYARMLVAMVLPVAGPLLDPIVSAATEALLLVVRGADAVPGSSLHVVPPGPAWVMAALAWVTWWARRPRPDRWRRPAVALLALAAWLLAVQVTLPAAPRLRLDLLAVGDGTCALLRSGGRAVLFDAGSSRRDAGPAIVVPALRRLGVRRLDAIVISHPNLDHYSAVLDVAAALPVTRVLVTGSFAAAAADPAGPTAHVRATLAARGVPTRTVSAGHRGRLGRTTWRWLHPPPGWGGPRSNDGSMAILVTAGRRRLLLLGDAEADGLAAIAAAHAPLAADIVELPHHGSHHATAEWFVRGLAPRLLLQSTGPRRLEDDPWPAALPGVPRLVTARDGAVWVEVSRSGRLRWGTSARPRRESLRARRAPPVASGGRACR